MKKLLSILAAVGLTATASSAVVACTTTLKAKDITITKDGENYKMVTKEFTAKLPVKLAADVKKGTVSAKDELAKDFGKLVWFGSDKKALDLKMSTDVANESVEVTKDAKKGDSKVNVKLTIELTAAGAKKLGLLTDDNKAGKDTTVYLGSEKDGKLDKTVFEMDLKASKFVDAK